MERLEKIRAKRSQLDAEIASEQQRRDDTVAYYTKEIIGLSERLNEIFEVAEEMVKNRITFGNPADCDRYLGDVFETNGITHRIGFIFEYDKGRGRDINYRRSVTGIGIQGGGCCGNDIVIDKNGIIVCNPLYKAFGCWSNDDAYSDFVKKAKSFLKGFDNFEQKFYNYVDNL